MSAYNYKKNLKIAQMLLAGLQNREIIEELKCTGNTIVHVKWATGWFDAYRPKQDTKAIIRQNPHMTARQLGRLTGRSHSHICNLVREMGMALPMSRKPHPVKPYRVTLALKCHNVPLYCVTLPYIYPDSDEWLVDLKGITGLHEEVPVEGVIGLDERAVAMMGKNQD